MSYSDDITEAVLIAIARKRSNQSRFAAEIGMKQPAFNARIRGKSPWTLRDLDVLAEHGVPIPSYESEADNELV